MNLYPSNIQIDFNDAPEHKGVRVPDGTEVGDTVRLVDLDATAGYLLATVTSTERRQYNTRLGPSVETYLHAHIEAVPGSYETWELPG